MTVINGPPERSRTRLPVRSPGAAWFCVAVFDGAEAEKAGAKGIPSATVTAIAIEACFVDDNILNSILDLCGLQALVATRMQSDANSSLHQPLVSRGLKRVARNV